MAYTDREEIERLVERRARTQTTEEALSVPSQRVRAIAARGPCSSCGERLTPAGCSNHRCERVRAAAAAARSTLRRDGVS